MSFLQAHQDRIVRMTEKAAIELFGGWGLALRPCGSTTMRKGVSAVVPLTGACLHGVAGLEINEALVELLPHLTGVGPRHWAKELVNQLTGRLRNDLLSDGVDVDMGVPSSLHFGRVLLDVSHLGAAEFYLQCGDGLVRVFFDFDPLADPGFGEALEATPLAEGQSLFF